MTTMIGYAIGIGVGIAMGVMGSRYGMAGGGIILFACLGGLLTVLALDILNERNWP